MNPQVRNYAYAYCNYTQSVLDYNRTRISSVSTIVRVRKEAHVCYSHCANRAEWSFCHTHWQSQWEQTTESESEALIEWIAVCSCALSSAVAAVGLLEGVGAAAGGHPDLRSGRRAPRCRRPLQRRLEGALRALEPSQPEPRMCSDLLLSASFCFCFFNALIYN